MVNCDSLRVQSFSSAVHPLCRLTDSQVALFFRAEDGRIALLGSAKLSRSYPGVDSKGTYRNGERLYMQAVPCCPFCPHTASLSLPHMEMCQEFPFRRPSSIGFFKIESTGNTL